MDDTKDFPDKNNNDSAVKIDDEDMKEESTVESAVEQPIAPRDQTGSQLDQAAEPPTGNNIKLLLKYLSGHLNSNSRSKWDDNKFKQFMKHKNKLKIFVKRDENIGENSTGFKLCSQQNAIVQRENSIGERLNGNQTNEDEYNGVNLREVEDQMWNGDASKMVKRKKFKSLNSTTHPENEENSANELDNIQNGNHIIPFVEQFDNIEIMYMVVNTCPFDSILQSLAAGYNDVMTYAECIKDTNANVIRSAKFLVDYGVNSNLYCQRKMILETCDFESKLDNNGLVLDCKCNVNLLLKCLLKDAPSVWEYYTCSVEAKQTVISRVFYPINVNDLIEGSFKNLQNAINNGGPDPPSAMKCNQSGCNGTINVTRTLGAHIWFDTIINIGDDYLMCKLGDLPDQIQIDNTAYKCTAVIAFIKNGKYGNMGHYVAYCKRMYGYWEEYNDLFTTIDRRDPSLDVMPHTIFYTKM